MTEYRDMDAEDEILFGVGKQDSIPAGRVLVPGADCTPHAGKSLRVGALVAAILLVLGAWCIVSAISLAVSA